MNNASLFFIFMETNNPENKPSWFKYLHKLYGSNWRKRLGNFYCKADWNKLSKEYPEEIGNYFPYYEVRNAIFLELRESVEYRELRSRIKLSKKQKSHNNKIYLGYKEISKKQLNILNKLCNDGNIIYYQSMVTYHKKLIKMYKKALLDLIRKRFEQES